MTDADVMEAGGGGADGAVTQLAETGIREPVPIERSRPTRRPRLNRLPIAAVIILSLVAVVGFAGAWQAATGRGGSALVLAVVIIIGLLGFVVVLDVAAFRPRAGRLAGYALGLSVTAAGFGVIAWLGAAGAAPLGAVWAGFLALLLIRPLLGGIWASARPREIWWQLLAAIGLWNAVLGIFIVVGPGVPGWRELVWDSSDQLRLYNQSVSLLDGNFDQFSFLLGVPIVISLAGLVTGFTGLESIEAASLANAMLLPAYILLVLPVLVWTIARGALWAVRVRPSSARVLAGTALAAGVILAYVLLPPGYVPERNAELVPRRVLGLVFGPEPLGYAALAGAALLLARRDRAWHPVPVGVVVGIVAMLNERFVPSAALFLLLLFVITPERRRALTTSLAAAATFLPQLVYFRTVYGGWLFPNREFQWERVDRAVVWGDYAHERYGAPADQAPDRMSLDYFAINASDMVQAYWPVLVLLGAALVLLVWRLPRQWPLWTLCAGHFALTFVQSAIVINLVVTWRYNSAILPVAGFLVAAAMWSLVTPSHAREAASALPEPEGVASVTGWRQVLRGRRRVEALP